MEKVEPTSDSQRLIEQANRQAQAHWDFMTQEEREQYAWLAGIIDGEGCIRIHRYPRKDNLFGYQLELCVHMTCEKTINRIKELTRVGTILICQERAPRKTRYDWASRDQEAASILRRCLRYLVTKRDRAVLGIHFAEERHSRRGNIERQKKIKELIQKLNG